ncbi:MAG: hypothetical protein DWP97_02905 [Calditrichaeota bacterium]|nr:MAG: hypothetical protein DWP97_02905 [Calditrichota bacterium]
MSKLLAIGQLNENVDHPESIGRKIGFLATSALLLSTGIIWFHNNVLYNEEVVEIYSQLELALITLMPYMISAAIAAITSISIMNIIPLSKSKAPAGIIAERIKSFGEGNLEGVFRPDVSNTNLEQITSELNIAIGHWNSRASQIKIINRQQWDLLQDIRSRAAKKGDDGILINVKRMEENWERVAKIEENIAL